MIYSILFFSFFVMLAVLPVGVIFGVLYGSDHIEMFFFLPLCFVIYYILNFWMFSLYFEYF